MILKYKNEFNEEIVLNNPYKIVDWDDEIDENVELTSIPFVDGNIQTNYYTQAREITINLIIIGNIPSLRQDLIKIFNPKKQGYLMTNNRMIQVRPVQIIPFNELGSGRKYQKIQIRFIAPYPFYSTFNPIEFNMISYVKEFRLPFSFPISFGYYGWNGNVINHGDVSAPILITAKGPLLNPKFYNKTTKEMISINYNILPGQTLEIYTKPGEKYCKLISGETETNLFYSLSTDTVFWQLIPGLNEIQYCGDGEQTSSETKTETKISFYEWYRGI